MPLLVWIQGVKGPEAQIWHVDQTTGEGKRKDNNILAEHKITDAEVKEGFSILIDRYAPPQAQQL